MKGKRDCHQVEEESCDFRVSKVVLEEAGCGQPEEGGQSCRRQWIKGGIPFSQELDQRKKRPDHEDQPAEKGRDSSFGSDLDHVVVQMDVCSRLIGKLKPWVFENNIDCVRSCSQKRTVLDDGDPCFYVFYPVPVRWAFHAECAECPLFNGLRTHKKEEPDSDRQKDEALGLVKEEDDAGGDDNPQPCASRQGEDQGSERKKISSAPYKTPFVFGKDEHAHSRRAEEKQQSCLCHVVAHESCDSLTGCGPEKKVEVGVKKADAS